MSRFQFPSWTNRAVVIAALVALVGGIYAIGVLAYGTAPETTNVGYSPSQPVPFSHKLHAGQMKMDCRYCHTSVDKAAHAAVPATQTCVNCHSAANPDGTVTNSAIHTASEKLAAVFQSQATGDSIPWKRVHDLPDHVHFNHSAHVNRGVSCVSCHGRVDKMEQVVQTEPLSMSWCLDCHRNPEPHLRPQEFITQLDWEPEGDPAELGALLRAEKNIHPSTNCSTCHR